MKSHRTVWAIAVGFAAVALCGQAEAGGFFDLGKVASALKAGKSIIKAAEVITPEREYIIGRAVAATILNAHQALDDEELDLKINLIGQSMAVMCERPEIFGGYHFLVVDSEEPNAFASPGGHILITKGMLETCATDEEIAAVLAHEISHIERQHGVKAIKKSRVTKAFLTTATEAGRQSGDKGSAELARFLEGGVSEVVTTLTEKGYSRQTEYEADTSAVAILKRANIAPQALITVLRRMDKKYSGSKLGIFKTHPSPAGRIEHIENVIAGRPAKKTARSPRRRK